MMPKSDHFDGDRFFNPTGPMVQPLSAVPRMLTERRAPWPARVDEPARRPPVLDGATATVTSIGHSTFLIQTATGSILTDPMYSQRAGPLNVFGPRRVRQPAVRFEDLPPVTTVLLSHNHYDHCDLPTLRRLARRFDPLVVTPIGNGRLVRSAGITRVEELDWWQGARSSAVPITLTPAHHFSARGILDRNRALWSGFMLGLPGAGIFFAGDTAYAPHFREIRERLGPIDLALLPIGAYEPRWFMRSVHMNPAEAVQAHIDLAASQSIGIDAPLRALEEAHQVRGIPSSQFLTLGSGESIRVNGGRASPLI
jgi:L-ascorbate metabolism protein UlaG (beta-lactamase superfamily)